MKCSFLDYIQFLMICQVVRVMNVDQNMKKRAPKSLKNEMFIFGLCSISDDQPIDLSEEHRPKCAKRPPKLLKNEMFVLDYVQFLMIGQMIQAMNIDQNVKKGPLSHQKMKCHFWSMFNF